jgi:hypothetical protein
MFDIKGFKNFDAVDRIAVWIWSTFYTSHRISSFWFRLSWQIAKLQDDNRALDRLTKSKEAALLVAERTVQTAEAKASMVDDLQNRNQELMKQIEICQVRSNDFAVVVRGLFQVLHCD